MSFSPRVAAALFLAAAGILAVQGEFRMPLNGDAAYHIDAARRMIGGSKLYRDIYDMNPPFIFWASFPAAWFGSDGESAVSVFRVTVLGIIIGAFALSWRSVQSVPALWLGFLLMAIVLPIGYFGQREHILFALLFPYVAVTCSRETGRRVTLPDAVLSGALAAVAVALKPTAVLAPLLLLGIQWWESGRIRTFVRPEHLSLIAGMGVAVLAVLLITPTYLEVVSVVQGPYRAFNRQQLATLLTRDIHMWSVWFALLAAVLFAKDLETRRRTIVLAAAMIGLFASAILQMKGFGYHYFPAVAFSVILMVDLLLAAGTRGMRGVVRRTAVAVLLLPTMYLFGAVALRRAGGVHTEAAADQAAVARLIGDEPTTVAVLSARIADAFPVILTRNHTFVLRYPLFWVAALPPAYPGTDSIRRHYAEDVARALPAVLIVRSAKAQPGADPAVDYLEFLCRDPVAAAVLSGYHLAGHERGFNLYRTTGEGAAACVSS